jgi:ribosomal-protein-alanine N-acetyltransferase
MKPITTRRLTLRSFTPADWNDLHELSLDWSKAPGPAFDKWPKDEEGTKGLTTYFVEHDRFIAVCLNESGKVIGLVAINDIDQKGRQDVGHVIHSQYQDNDIDREALEAAVAYVFDTAEVDVIVTHNDPNKPQLAPLRSLGFQDSGAEEGELVLNREEWEKR